MIINYKGLIELTLGGKVVVFKFNMAAFTLLNDLQGCSMSELSQQLSGAPRFSTFANFLFAGAETAYIQNGKNADEKGNRTFSIHDGPEWMNEIEVKDIQNLVLKAFDTPEITTPETKNVQPLESQGS